MGKSITIPCWRDSPVLLWGQRFGHIVKMIVLPAFCHGWCGWNAWLGRGRLASRCLESGFAVGSSEGFKTLIVSVPPTPRRLGLSSLRSLRRMVWSSKEKGRGEAGRAKEGGQSQAHSRVWSKVSPSAQASKATIACIPRHCSAAFLPGITWVWAEFWHGNGEFCWLEGTYSATRSSWLFRAVAEGANCQSLYDKLALWVLFNCNYLSSFSVLQQNELHLWLCSMTYTAEVATLQHKLILFGIFITDHPFIFVLNINVWGFFITLFKVANSFIWILNMCCYNVIRKFDCLLQKILKRGESENWNNQTSHIYRCLRNTKLLFKRKQFKATLICMSICWISLGVFTYRELRLKRSWSSPLFSTVVEHVQM